MNFSAENKLSVLRQQLKALFCFIQLAYSGGKKLVRFSSIGNSLKKIMAIAFVMVSLHVPVAHALTDEEVLRGFNLTVFGSEIAPLGFQVRYVHKFRNEVRFKVHNLSSKNRMPAVVNFINGLEDDIAGLKVRIVEDGNAANFNVYVVNRSDYQRVVRDRIQERSNASEPSKCLVKSHFSRAGISRSDAVIVSDEGEALFKRCLIEEILQGLGPLNESTTLKHSVFNDTSKHTRFTRFDRLILNMLYDKRIKNGASERAVGRVLEEVLSDTRRRLGF